MTQPPLEDYPRVAIVQKITDREIAWLKPFARVSERYYSELPDEEYSEWGTEYLALVALKGSEVYVGDAFQTWNPNTDKRDDGLPSVPIEGSYIPNLENLRGK